MECFLGGFREEFKLLVKPKSLQEAYEMAARQENVYEMLKRPKNLQKNPLSSQNQTSQNHNKPKYNPNVSKFNNATLRAS